MNKTLANHNFAEYFNYYISLVSNSPDVNTALEQTHKTTNDLLDLITEEKGNYVYADGKWTIKELLVHLIDTERIFCNRALRFARNDQTDLPGYNHDEYVPNSGANERKLNDISNEFNIVRQGTIALFNSFTPEMLERKGTANGNNLTVLAIGFVISGHEKHHVNILDERYL
ncbi:MAG: damage-inducible protein DinB [Flavobacteriales bacterium]|nr:MAG: damage-inducible protein DinB [Flavobacteriales bacterium]